jgi:UDP-N-acetylmuramoyl-tripeptide--D-alanyl-D-alanine ligase
MTTATLAWTTNDIVAATGGTLFNSAGFNSAGFNSAGIDSTGGDCPITGISIDSRSCKTGDLFVALPGAQANGHQFLAKADAAGALAALVTQPDADLALAQIQVADTLDALRHLAIAGRGRFTGVQFGITGSVGKTGSKDMLHHLLSHFGTCHASQRSFNNHIGVPLSLASLPETADFAVQEMGMNAAGEIANLTKLARPHIAFITRIADTHSAFFASTADIAQAKAEIFQGLEDNGTAILNRDDAFFGILKAAALDAGAAAILTFGRHQDADFRLLDIDHHDTGMTITAKLRTAECRFEMRMHGSHLAENAMGVLACIAAAGLPADSAAAYLVNCQPPAGRGQRIQGVYQDHLITVIDDSYNASPASMAAAFAGLAGTPPQIMVLSEMRELGNASDSAHAALAPQINILAPRVVIAIGAAMKTTVAALDRSITAICVADPDAAIAPLAQSIVDGDCIFIKGSNGSGAWQVRDALCASMTSTATTAPQNGASHAA